ncbi:unnamed protein product [Effrenium voratum]|nr:unnamed protein product [Effrenium voratum]
MALGCEVTLESTERGPSKVVGLKYHPPMNNRDRGLVIKDIVLDSRMDEHNKTSVRRKNFHHVVMNGMVIEGVNDVEGAGQKLQRALLEDEASGDDRGRSPRGAGGFATRAAEFAERRLAEATGAGGVRRGADFERQANPFLALKWPCG